MSITPEQVGQAVVKAIPGFFNDAIDQLRDGEGAYIRDGMPSGIVAQIGQAVARSACRRYGAQGPDAVGSKGERFERACRPYLDSLEPGQGAQIVVPFDGGQCNEIYVINFDFNVPNGNPPNQNLAVRARGPISGATFFIRPNGTNTIRFNAFSGFVPGTNACGTVPGANQPTVNTLSNNINVNAQGLTVSVVPCGLDNCGDPPPEVRPPRPIPDPSPPPFRFNPGPGVDINIDVDLNPDGTIDVDFGDGTINIDPFPDDGGGDGGGGPGGGPGDPTDPGAAGDAADTGPGGDAEGEAEEDEELVGVLVEVLQAPQSPNVFSNNSSQPFRGIGYVRMGYPNRLGVDISGGTVISPQFFHAQQRGLTNWAVSANTGFNLRTTPYYRSIEVNV